MSGWHRLCRLSRVSGLLALLLAFGWSGAAQAANPPPASGSIGLEGTISSAPPTRAATIGIPANGAVFNSIPITISGICQTGLLIKIFDNNVFVGSVVCTNGSYSLQIDLFSGQNQIVARDYDALDQAGPDSQTITVTYNDAQFLQLGSLLTLTSAYAERGAPPGAELAWPVTLNGGTAPYAVSVDWGDAKPADLMSAAVAGNLTLKHIYKLAGTYRVLVKATDKNGQIAFLQLVGQATGAVQNNSKPSSNAMVERQVAWWPTFTMMPLLFVSFWIGKRYELYSIRHRFDNVE